MLNRGVHEYRKHDEDCEGSHKSIFAVCYSLPQAPDGGSENSGLNETGLEWEAEEGRVCDDARQCPLNSKLLYELAFRCFTRMPFRARGLTYDV